MSQFFLNLFSNVPFMATLGGIIGLALYLLTVFGILKTPAPTQTGQ